MGFAAAGPGARCPVAPFAPVAPRSPVVNTGLRKIGQDAKDEGSAGIRQVLAVKVEGRRLAEILSPRP